MIPGVLAFFLLSQGVVEAGSFRIPPEGPSTLEGGVVLRWGETILTADSLSYDPETGEVIVVGAFVLESPLWRLRAEGLEGRWGPLGLEEGVATRPRISVPPSIAHMPGWELAGNSIQFHGNSWVIPELQVGTWDPVEKSGLWLGADLATIRPLGDETLELTMEGTRGKMWGFPIFKWHRIQRVVTLSDTPRSLLGVSPVLSRHNETGLRFGLAVEGMLIGDASWSGEVVGVEEGATRAWTAFRLPISEKWEGDVRFGSAFETGATGVAEWVRESPSFRLNGQVPWEDWEGGIAVGWGKFYSPQAEVKGMWVGSMRLGRHWEGAVDWEVWSSLSSASGLGTTWVSHQLGVMGRVRRDWGDFGLGGGILDRKNRHPLPTREIIPYKGPIGEIFLTPGSGWGFGGRGEWDWGEGNWASASLLLMKEIHGMALVLGWDALRHTWGLDIQLATLP